MARREGRVVGSRWCKRAALRHEGVVRSRASAFACARGRPSMPVGADLLELALAPLPLSNHFSTASLARQSTSVVPSDGSIALTGKCLLSLA
eukprot:2502403-Pleurochrysis_carterae.AAC.2